jgi:hypothetical protein
MGSSIAARLSLAVRIRGGGRDRLQPHLAPSAILPLDPHWSPASRLIARSLCGKGADAWLLQCAKGSWLEDHIAVPGSDEERARR